MDDNAVDGHMLGEIDKADRVACHRSEARATARQSAVMLPCMKYSQLRRGLSPEDAAAYVGSKELLRQFERAKWVKPFVRGNRLTRFDIRDLDGCIDRLKAGELLSTATPSVATP